MSDLAGRTVRGILWNVGTGVVARVLTLVGTAVLTRFLAKEDYGQVIGASIWVLTASQLTTIRFGQYLIAVKPGRPDAPFAAAVYHVGIGAVALALVVGLAGPLGGVIGAPGSHAFFAGMAVAVLFERIAYVPAALLARDLKFRQLALSRTGGEILYVVTAVGLARNHGGMAIIYGHIARWVFYAACVAILAPRREWMTPHKISRQTTRDLFAFGIPIAVGSAADFGATKWDNLLVSGFFDPGIMGMYNLAYQLADTPTSYIAEQVSDVLFPSLATVEPSRRGQALVRAAAVMGLIVFPMAVGLATVADTLIRSFFLEGWYFVAPMLSILSMLSIARPISWVAISYLQAEKRPRSVMWLGLFKVFTITLALATIGWIGPLWTCIAVSIGFTVFSVATLLVIQKDHGIPLGKFAAGMFRPLLACAVMAGAVLLVRRVSGLEPDTPRLILEIVVGIVAYVGGAFVFARPIVQDFIGLARKAFGRRRG